jgi:hypothetical protein
MFRHAVGSGKPRHLRRLFSRVASSSGPRTLPIFVVSSAILAASALWYSPNKRIYNDASSVLKEKPVLKLSTEMDIDDDKLSVVVWGSNR